MAIKPESLLPPLPFHALISRLLGMGGRAGSRAHFFLSRNSAHFPKELLRFGWQVICGCLSTKHVLGDISI